LATDINAEHRYPWLSWATTGVLTLVVMLGVGLVISAQHPPLQAALPKGASPTRTSADASAASATSATVPRTSASLPVQDVATTAPEAVPAAPAASDPVNATPPTTPRVASQRPPDPSPPDQLPVRADRPPQTGSHTVQPPPAVHEVPDAVKQSAYVKAVASIRQAMAQRNLAASKRLLKTAADKAQNDAQHAEVEHLEMIQDHLERFWDGIRKAVAEMQPTDEIVLSESNRVAVIESSRTELAVQWEGRPRRYRIEAMPMELLSAVAKLTPGSKLVVGSFLAVDAHGDRAEARKLWREAIASGEKDGELLMPELDVTAQIGR
jgi:hypothetical protein